MTAPARPQAGGFVLPAPSDALDLAMDDGAPIRVLRHGDPAGPRVVLSHGNGFASDTYFPFWRPMLARFDLALFDFRNCGRNPFHAARPHGYHRFARDSAAVHAAIADRWGAKTTVGVFHSMSATTALLAAVDGVWHWDALLLFDPPVMPPRGDPLGEALMREGRALRDATAIRKQAFADPDELAEVFRCLYPFRRLAEGVPELVARTTLRRDADAGGWVLRCPAPLEAGVYVEVGALPVWERAGPPARPLAIVGADPGLADAPQTAHCNRAFCETFGIDFAFVPGTGHLMQLEEPERCFALFENFLAENGIAA